MKCETLTEIKCAYLKNKIDPNNPFYIILLFHLFFSEIDCYNFKFVKKYSNMRIRALTDIRICSDKFVID